MEYLKRLSLSKLNYININIHVNILQIYTLCVCIYIYKIQNIQGLKLTFHSPANFEIDQKKGHFAHNFRREIAQTLDESWT